VAGVISGGDIYNGIKADPYDPTAALSFLAAAGYNTGVAPPNTTVGGGVGGVTVTVPPIQVSNGPVPAISTSCTPVTPPKPNSTTVTVPTFLVGNALTWSGSFPVIAAKGVAAGGYAVTLQQSTDAKSWTPVVLGATTTGGYYSLSYSPSITGTVSYRVFFTGLPETFLTPLGPSSPALPEAYVPPLAPADALPVSNTTATQYSAISTYTIGSLADVVAAITSSVNTAVTSSAAITNANINNGLCTLETSLATSINGALSTLATQNTVNANALKTSLNGLGNSTNTALGKLSNQTNTALSGLQTNSASKSDVTSLSNNVGSLTTQVSNLNSQISTLSTVAYAAIGIAVVLGLVAIGLSVRKRGM
jgi:hypothetical protein